MTDAEWSPTHRQLVSAVLCLTHADVLGEDSSVLSQFGYSLNAIELPLVDHHGRGYKLDIHLVNIERNISLLVDCKTYAGFLKQDQIGKYLATTGSEAVQFGHLEVPQPRTHKADPAFFILESVEPELIRLVGQCDTPLCSGWGIIRVERSRMVSSHNEFSDAELGASLENGWGIDLLSLELERLPFGPDSPDWELASAIFQTIVSMFVADVREFSVFDLCIASNEFWPYLEEHHLHIMNRVRDLMRSARRTSLRGWIRKVDQPSGREERWQFIKKSTMKQNVLGGLQRRNAKYVRILSEERRNPMRDDFKPEQLGLPLDSA